MKTKLHNKIILIAIILSFIFIAYMGYIIICKHLIYPIRYNKYVFEASKEYNVDPYLVFAIIKQESNFNKDAYSGKEAKGLMQVLDSTAKEMATDINNMVVENLDLFDAKTNIYIGVKYFRTLVNRYDGNTWLAICAYNAGLGNVDKWILSDEIYLNSKMNISNIPFEETRTYLVNILKYYDKYVKLYN